MQYDPPQDPNVFIHRVWHEWAEKEVLLVSFYQRRKLMWNFCISEGFLWLRENALMMLMTLFLRLARGMRASNSQNPSASLASSNGPSWQKHDSFNGSVGSLATVSSATQSSLLHSEEAKKLMSREDCYTLQPGGKLETLESTKHYGSSDLQTTVSRYLLYQMDLLKLQAEAASFLSPPPYILEQFGETLASTAGTKTASVVNRVNVLTDTQAKVAQNASSEVDDDIEAFVEQKLKELEFVNQSTYLPAQMHPVFVPNHLKGHSCPHSEVHGAANIGVDSLIATELDRTFEVGKKQVSKLESSSAGSDTAKDIGESSIISKHIVNGTPWERELVGLFVELVKLKAGLGSTCLVTMKNLWHDLIKTACSLGAFRWYSVVGFSSWVWTGVSRAFVKSDREI
ncbi:hypothetical protein RJ641_033014 [Dillenia turbinata]|uniref:Uncharacterized protein n=1 Tax=Dillenia turbinata TaxID=194707 RepID=A0AAN8ZCY4_9MAGN